MVLGPSETMLGPSESEDNSASNIVLGTLCIVIFSVGTLANIFTLIYFTLCKGYKSTSQLLYLCINSVDIMICVLTLPMAVSYLQGRTAGMFQWSVFCNVWGVLWNITIRLSVFLIALLSITRTVKLLKPMRHMKHRYILGIAVMYLLAMLLQACIPFYYNIQYSYKPYLVLSTWSVRDVFELHSKSSTAIKILLVHVEMILPLFPVTICCVVTIIALRRSHTQLSQQGSNPTQSRVKAAATVTIVVLTLNYIIFNLPLAVYIITGQVEELYPNTSEWRSNFFGWDARAGYITNHVVTKLSVGLNSLINPGLYFWRLKAMRVFAREEVEKVMRRLLKNKKERGSFVRPDRTVGLYKLGSDSRITVVNNSEGVMEVNYCSDCN